MDWRKVDAPLAAALAGAADDQPLPVFVDLHPAAGHVPGLPEGTGNSRTATLRPAQVLALTEQPAVHRIRLSGRMRLLEET